MVLPSLEYFYLFNYASPTSVSRLYFAAPKGDINLGGYERLGKWQASISN